MRTPSRGFFWAATPAVFAIFFFLGAMLARLACVAAEPATDQPTVLLDAETVHRMVRQLAAGSLVARDAAEQGLLACGPTILPLLVAAEPSAAAEAVFRLHGIKRQLEEQAAVAAVEPATITLALQSASARDVLERVFNQSGSRIALDASVANGSVGERLITVDFNRSTFWEAIEEVLEKSGLQLSFAEIGAGLSIGPASDLASDRALNRVVAAGPLRLAIARVEPTGSASAAQPTGARIVLRISWEPRLEPLLIRLPIVSVVAEGSFGEAMPPPQRTAVVEAMIPKQRKWVDLPLMLTQPASRLESLGLLRGTVELLLTGREHVFVFDRLTTVEDAPNRISPETPRRLSAGRVGVSISQFAVRGDRLHATASVAYDAPTEALASHRMWLTERPLNLLDANGRAVTRLEQFVLSRSEQGLTTSATFSLQGVGDEPASLPQGLRIEWNIPVAIHEVPVDFSIRNIALPNAVRPLPAENLRP